MIKIKTETLKFLSFAICIFFIPLLISGGYMMNVLVFVGINTILAVALNLLLGYAGQISLGHAAFFGLGAYISGVLTVTYSMNSWLAMVVAALTTGLLAFM